MVNNGDVVMVINPKAAFGGIKPPPNPLGIAREAPNTTNAVPVTFKNWNHGWCYDNDSDDATTWLIATQNLKLHKPTLIEKLYS
jgi:hypothetical protein